SSASGRPTAKSSSAAKHSGAMSDAERKRIAQSNKHKQEREEERRLLEKEKKAAKRRRYYAKHSKLINGLMYAAIFAVVIGIVVLLSVTVFFKVESIDYVLGEGNVYTMEEVAAHMGIKTGESLFLADTDAAAQRLEQELPYIEKCTITRRMPSTLRVDITAVTEIGVIETPGHGKLVISSTGKALKYTADDNEAAAYTAINGLVVNEDVQPGYPVPFAEPDKLEVAARIVELLSGKQLRAGSIDFSEASVSFMYEGRIRVKLGALTGMDEKILLACEILTGGTIQEYEKGDLDMTIEGEGHFIADYVMEAYGLGEKNEVTDPTQSPQAA
ncbi:MAG: FtsQ-type POTRA domain-containing protein, partial [Clostridia bacterium]|nr:FtsQ-type POTRA domain-containing protein [Clostridia bacterium]